MPFRIQRDPSQFVGGMPGYDSRSRYQESLAALQESQRQGSDLSEKKREQELGILANLLQQRQQGAQQMDLERLRAGLGEQASQADYGRNLGLLDAESGYQSRAAQVSRQHDRDMSELDSEQERTRMGIEFDNSLQELATRHGYDQDLSSQGHEQQLSRDRLYDEIKRGQMELEQGFGMDRLSADAMYKSRADAERMAFDERQNMRGLQARLGELALGHRFGQEDIQLQHGNQMARDEALEKYGTNRLGLEQQFELDRDRQKGDINRQYLESQYGLLGDRDKSQFGYQQQLDQGGRDWDYLQNTNQQMDAALNMLKDVQAVDDKQPLIDDWRGRAVALLSAEELQGDPSGMASEQAKMLRELGQILGSTKLQPKQKPVDYLRDNMFRFDEVYPGSPNVGIPQGDGIYKVFNVNQQPDVPLQEATMARNILLQRGVMEPTPEQINSVINEDRSARGMKPIPMPSAGQAGSSPAPVPEPPLPQPPPQAQQPQSWAGRAGGWIAARAAGIQERMGQPSPPQPQSSAGRAGGGISAHAAAIQARMGQPQPPPQPQPGQQQPQFGRQLGQQLPPQPQPQPGQQPPPAQQANDPVSNARQVLLEARRRFPNANSIDDFPPEWASLVSDARKIIEGS